MLAYFLRRILISGASLLIISYALWLLTTRNGINFLHQFDATQIFFPPDYLKWINAIAHGDFGYSLRARMPMIDAFRTYLPITLLLLIPAFIAQEILAITAGVTAATRPRSPVGIWLQYFFVVAASMPIFWLALMAITLFGVILHWFPFIGLSSLRLTGADFGTPAYWQFFHAHTWEAIVDIGQHLVMPLTLVVLVNSAYDSQLARVSMLEVLNQDYVRSARAHGVAEWRVIWKHAFRNSLLPLITNLGLQLPRLLISVTIIEFFFTIPGIGLLFIRALFVEPPRAIAGVSLGAPPKDYATVSGYFILLAVITVVWSLLIDSSYAFADPRIRVSDGNRAAAANNGFQARRNAARPLLQVGNIAVTWARIGIAVVILISSGDLVYNRFFAAQVTAVNIAQRLTGSWYGTETSSRIRVPEGLLLTITAAPNRESFAATATICSPYSGLTTYTATVNVSAQHLIHFDLAPTATLQNYTTNYYSLDTQLPATNAVMKIIGFQGTSPVAQSAVVTATLQRGTMQEYTQLCIMLDAAQP